MDKDIPEDFPPALPFLTFDPDESPLLLAAALFNDLPDPLVAVLVLADAFPDLMTVADDEAAASVASASKQFIMPVQDLKGHR